MRELFSTEDVSNLFLIIIDRSLMRRKWKLECSLIVICFLLKGHLCHNLNGCFYYSSCHTTALWFIQLLRLKIRLRRTFLTGRAGERTQKYIFLVQVLKCLIWNVLNFKKYFSVNKYTERAAQPHQFRSWGVSSLKPFCGFRGSW